MWHYLSLSLSLSLLLILPLPLIGWNMPTAGSPYTLIEEDRGWCENPQCCWLHLRHSFAHHPLTKPTTVFGHPAGFCDRQVRQCRRKEDKSCGLTHVNTLLFTSLCVHLFVFHHSAIAIFLSTLSRRETCTKSKDYLKSLYWGAFHSLITSW